MGISIPEYRTILNEYNEEVKAKSLRAFNNRYVVTEEGNIYKVEAYYECGFDGVSFVCKKLNNSPHMEFKKNKFVEVYLYDYHIHKNVKLRLDMLIANAFEIPHPKGNNTLIHKNNDITDNRVSNLAWI